MQREIYDRFGVRAVFWCAGGLLVVAIMLLLIAVYKGMLGISSDPERLR